jgi:ribosomal-protein-alanine N-acetyltransferase
MKITPTLNTERLLLRPFVQEDAPRVYAWCSSSQVTEHLFWHPHRDLAVTERVLADWIKKKRNYFWALDDGTGAIGEIEIIKDFSDGGCEIGYVLLQEKWGQGYMKEALRAVLSFLFQEGRYGYVYAEVDSANAVSLGLLARLGFRVTGSELGLYVSKIDRKVDKTFLRLEKKDFLMKGNGGF